jgi:pimeloyl-ACP methyl ester carboxylesterase
LGVDFDTARSIRLGEWDAEDAEQALSAGEWPAEGAGRKGWRASVGNGSYSRSVDKPDDFQGNWEGKLETLREQVLRFPSAPIHGLHRLSQEHVNMGPVESFHTFRILSHPRRRGKVKRIFLLHNGLNETQKMGLYYRLAFFLIEQDPDTVCILRPFPGHLTRGASIGLAETPLDHYLWDGLHLFRQFLRYMIETRWLLSSIVRYSTYRCVSGSGLLSEREELDESRLDPGILGDAIADEWTALYDASRKVIEKQGGGSPQMPEEVPHEDAFRQAITSLRSALRLDRYDPADGISYEEDSEPELHVIGYSLGGFAAQSVFMSWPFLVSSCSTLLSGGALRELSPTAFADPEEWQTVLHSLRYELDDAMLDPRFTPPSKKDPRVAGIDPNLFLFLKRTFYEVFEQEYRGSFQTRLVAFRQRMLFVVGGNDPIVRPQSVLDAGPPDGINLIAIGGLGHFLEGSPKGQPEKEQRLFWLPEIGRTISKLADKAATQHREALAETWLDEDYLVPEPGSAEEQPQEQEKEQEQEQEAEEREENEEATVTVNRLSIAERLAVAKNGSLPSRIFQRSLDDLLARVVKGEDDDEQLSNGLLFILKNEAPTFLLDRRALQQHAAALYHEDVGIVKHVREVRSRIPVITNARNRICVVLPWNIETVTRYIDAGLQHPSQSESSGEQMVEVPNSKETWKNLYGTCMEWTEGEYEESIRVFDGRDGVDVAPGAREEIGKLSAAARTFLGIDKQDEPIKPALPDCWVWMSNEFLGLAKHEPPSIDHGRWRLCEKIPRLLDRGEDGERSAEVETDIAEHLRKDDLRMVTISRARYNPRYRGRIIVEPRPAQEMLLRVALCIAASTPFRKYPFEKVSPRRRTSPASASR